MIKQRNSILILLVIIGVVLINGCVKSPTGEVIKEVVCNKPYIQVGAECCLDKDDNGICDKDEEMTTKDVEKVIEYICPDGKTIVSSIDDCPVEEVIISNDYDFISVNKQMTKSSSYWNNDIKVTLLKVGVKKYGDKMRIRPYWKIENLGTKPVSVYPHMETIVLDGLGGQYESSLFSKEDESDDFSLGGSSGGDLRPGVIAQGGVSVDNIPSNAKNLQILLDLTGFEEFEFNVKIN